MTTIRDAEARDIPAVTEIYNHAIATSTCTFHTEPRSAEYQRAWFGEHDRRHPLVVADFDGEVAGWASLDRWSERPAYADTVELRVYVAEARRGKGIGRQLVESVLLRARGAGIHAVISLITAGNDASVRLHESLGFSHVGVIREVGRKFGRLLDVIVMEMILG